MLAETTTDQLDGMLDALHRAKDVWAGTSKEQRLQLLSALRDSVFKVAARWSEACAAAKGLDVRDPLAGEEWAIGPMVILRNLRLLQRTLEADCRDPLPRVGPGRYRVMPTDWWDPFLWVGISGEVWVQKDKPETRGSYRSQAPKLALVLGAGNVSSIVAADVVHKLFAENQVVLLKMNPVNAYLGPLLEEAFAPLIERGFLRVIYGGAEIGQKACQHRLVEAIHITGSHHTYNAIAPSLPDGREISSELGSVTPILIVPGDWSPRSIAYQARHVAGMMSCNAGFNCNAAQLVITAKNWPFRDQFLQALKRAISGLGPRPAYYPGAEQRYAEFTSRYPQAQVLGTSKPGCLPWTLIPDVPARSGEYALRNEAFCGLLHEVPIEATSTEEFMVRATCFVNDEVWGNLSCGIVVSPKMRKRHPEAFSRMLEDLRYGGIAVNMWPGLLFGLMSTTWGAYPGNQPEDIQSGSGVVHNTYLFDHPEKSVLYGPWWTPFLPPWFPGHTRLLQIGAGLAEFERKPNLMTLARIHFEVLKDGLLIGRSAC